MILVYVDNKRINEVADIVKKFGKVGYRNPRYFDGPEKCDGVYVHGFYPDIRAAYDNVIERTVPLVERDEKTSSDFTIAQLRDMKPSMSNTRWSEFTTGDNRKSINQI